MIIEEITVTAFQQHTRIIGCEETRQAICIDPGDEAARIVETLERHGLTLQALARTQIVPPWAAPKRKKTPTPGKRSTCRGATSRCIERCPNSLRGSASRARCG